MMVIEERDESRDEEYSRKLTERVRAEMLNKPQGSVCDMVNHPSHYTQGGIECIDAIKSAVCGLTGMEAVCTANVIKYLWRWKFKNGVEDLEKAKWYLEKLIKLIEDANSVSRK